MNKDELITAAYEAFASFKRPQHFTDHTHCEECAEHDKTMQAVELHEIGPEQIGQACWTPIPYLTNQALCHIMPRLIEMALYEMPNNDGDPFLADFIRCVVSTHQNFESCSREQKAIIRDVVRYIKAEMSELVEFEGYTCELDEIIQTWVHIVEQEKDHES